MGFVFGDEPCGQMEECCPIVSCDRIIELIEFGIRDPICRSKHSGAAHDAPEERRGTLHQPHTERAEWRPEQGCRLPGMGMRVGEQSAIGDQHRLDARSKRLATCEALVLAREQFEHDERGVVEGDHEGVLHAMRLPLRFHQIGAFDGRVGVLPRRIRVALADVVEIEAWDQLIPFFPHIPKQGVNSGIAVGALGIPRQQGDPATGGIRCIGCATTPTTPNDPLKDHQVGCGQVIQVIICPEDAVVVGIVGNATPTAEPVGGGDEGVFLGNYSVHGELSLFLLLRADRREGNDDINQARLGVIDQA